jgi:DNA-binding transcriptional MerR regulator
MSDRPDLSQKLYHTIGEVADLTGVKAHVLRYWESEFPSLRPGKDRTGARRYRRRDIEEVLAIRELLYEQGYRIAGARQVLQQRTGSGGGRSGGAQAAGQLALGFEQLDRQQQLAEVRRELAEVLALVRGLRADATPGPAAGTRADAAEG